MGVENSGSHQQQEDSRRTLNKVFTSAMLELRHNLDAVGISVYATSMPADLAIVRQGLVGVEAEFLHYEEAGFVSRREREEFAYPSGINNNAIRIPAVIGEYGEEWSQRLVRAAATLVYAAVDSKSRCNIVAKIDSLRQAGNTIDVLNKFTFHRGYRADHLPGPLMTVVDGIQSVVIAAGIFTAFQISGYEDPMELLKACVTARAFSRLARIIPTTMIAKMGRTGRVLDNPLATIPETQRVVLREEVVKFLTNAKTNDYADIGTGAEEPLGDGCPVARVLPGHRVSGVDVAAKLLLDMVKAQWDIPLKSLQE